MADHWTDGEARPAPTVLALRALGLGDALTGIPALRGLRRAYPRHRLLIACSPQLGHWLTTMAVVDGVAPTHGLAPIAGIEHPDLAVNLHGRGPQSHEVLRRTNPQRLAGFACEAPGFDDGPPWNPSAHEVDRWCHLVHTLGGECDRSDLRLTPADPVERTGAVIVHPGAASPSRRWPVSHWRRVLAELCDEHNVVVTGGPDEEQLCATVCRGTDADCRAGRTALPQLARLVAGSRLVISGDTGIAHLATAFGIPSVTLFGPVSPALWGPAIDQDIHRCLWHGEDAGLLGDPHGETIDPRLAAITVDEVLAAVADLHAIADPKPIRPTLDRVGRGF